MKDAWNIKGVSWLNERIQRELAAVQEEGKALANRFLRNKLIFLAFVTAALAACLFYLGELSALAVELVLLFIAGQFIRKSSRGAMDPIYQRCDPFLEFAYIRAYGEMSLPITKTSRIRRVLSLAQCMALAGEPQAAIAIQSNIENLESLRPVDKGIYYNTLLLCYGQYGWEDKRRELCEEIKKLRDQGGKREAIQMNLILRLEEVKRRQDMGDIAYVEDYFRKIPPMYRFQEVGMHYALGMLYMKAGNAELAKEHVEFVLDKGNKLYYKKSLEEYLRSSLL